MDLLLINKPSSIWLRVPCTPGCEMISSGAGGFWIEEEPGGRQGGPPGPQETDIMTNVWSVVNGCKTKGEWWMAGGI